MRDRRTRPFLQTSAFAFAIFASASLTTQAGTANTVMFGEVNTGFRPWGDPVNWRDPGVGIAATPETFGGTSDAGVTLMMVDGSVRFVGKDTSQKVLRAIATPAAGD